MLGGELTGFDEFTMNLVTNSEILAMHANARHSHQVWRREIDGIEHALWIAADTKGGYYVAVFNLGDKDSDISIPLADHAKQAAVLQISSAKRLTSNSVGISGAVRVRAAFFVF